MSDLQWGIWIENDKRASWLRMSDVVEPRKRDAYRGPSVFNGEAGALEYIQLKNIRGGVPRQIPDHLRYPPYPRD